MCVLVHLSAAHHSQSVGVHTAGPGWHRGTTWGTTWRCRAVCRGPRVTRGRRKAAEVRWRRTTRPTKVRRRERRTTRRCSTTRGERRGARGKGRHALESRWRRTHSRRWWEGRSPRGSHYARWWWRETARSRRERWTSKSWRPAKTRRYKPGSAGCKMLRTKAESTWRRAAARFIGRRDLVNDTLRFVVTKGSIVISHIREVISPAVMSFAHRGRVMGQIDITIVTIVFLKNR